MSGDDKQTGCPYCYGWFARGMTEPCAVCKGCPNCCVCTGRRNPVCQGDGLCPGVCMYCLEYPKPGLAEIWP